MRNKRTSLFRIYNILNMEITAVFQVNIVLNRTCHNNRLCTLSVPFKNYFIAFKNLELKFIRITVLMRDANLTGFFQGGSY
ncbi:MAG TPA: hypothetical protein VK213_08695 [Bacteroidales bacterium]|nr:hypothetical protein [Bacteroidales bacterium]